MSWEQTSDAFIAARLERRALQAYPGEVPASLDAAYAIQARSISLWPDDVAGWKVAAIAPAWQDRYTAPRLAGPAFTKAVKWAVVSEPEMEVIPGGFAAVEAEFILRLADTLPEAPPNTIEEAAAHVLSMHCGLEIAGGPLESLNALGPGAVVSDFGNNAGLVIGPVVENWRTRDLATMTSAMEINGERVGEGSAANVPGGPLAALLFLWHHLARHNQQLKPGAFVSTGATTGIHPVTPGAKVDGVFADGRITVKIIAAKPASV